MELETHLTGDGQFEERYSLAADNFSLAKVKERFVKIGTSLIIPGDNIQLFYCYGRKQKFDSLDAVLCDMGLVSYELKVCPYNEVVFDRFDHKFVEETFYQPIWQYGLTFLGERVMKEMLSDNERILNFEVS